MPSFAQGARGGSERRVDVDLEPLEWRDLEQAARRERVTLAALIEHAAMFYLADYDLGRVGTSCGHRRALELARLSAGGDRSAPSSARLAFSARRPRW